MSVGEKIRGLPPASPQTPAPADDASLQLAHLAAIVESSDDAIVSKTLDGHILSWNAGAARIFGYQPEEAIGKSITIIIPPELRKEEFRILEKIRSGERVDHFETTRVRKDGRRIRVSLSVSPVRDGTGTIVAASKIARDIDVLKRAERTDAMLAAIVETSDDAIVSKSLDGIIQTWNASASRIFGYSAAEAIGQPVTLIIPPELQDEERQILKDLRKGVRIDHFDTTRLTKDGRRIPVSLTISPMRDASGTIIGASKIARDISDRAHAELALRESESLLVEEAQALVELNDASMRLWRSADLASGLAEILITAMEMLGADKGNVQLLDPDSQVLSIVTQRGFDEDYLEAFREVSAADNSACGRALRSGDPAIITDIEADAAYAPYREAARAAGYRAVFSTPLIGLDGTAIGMITACFGSVHRPHERKVRRLELYCRHASDFIQRCYIEQRLRENEDALRDADRRKDEFLAVLAHELRNPLAPIRYALAATKKAGRTAEQQRHAEEIIERQVAHMSRLLDDLLDISRITGGMLELKKARTELTVVIGTAIEAARPILDSKRHNLALDLPKEAVRLEADPVRLAQVFSNLLINAAKYTDPNGQIQLRAVREQGQLVVTVKDNGIGISAEMMPRLFTLFSQAHTALDRSEGGLGVGLALVRGLVNLHRGQIEARSEGPGRGSEFTVRLPLGAPPPDVSASESGAATPKSGAALKILVVDDNRDAADACSTLLELSGHHVQTAYTGEQGIELAKSFRPHALLLDIGLPDFTGYEVAQRIRSESWGADVVLVAVTGWGQDEDRRRAFDAGFDHHLTKPLAAESLETLVNAIGATMEARNRSH